MWTQSEQPGMAQQAVQLQQQFQARQAQLQFLQQMPQQQQYMVSQQQFQQQQQLQQQHQQLEQLLLQQQVQRQNAQYPAEQTNQINQPSQNGPQRHGQRWSRDKAQGQAPQEEEQAEPRWDRRWGRNHEQPTATGATTEEPQSNTLVKIDWGRQQRAAFQRCFLPQCNTELPGAENLRHQMGICIEDKGDMHVLPAPTATFDELNHLLPSYVLDGLQWNGIKNPLPIQAQALPLVLSGLDVIGIAQTGSGKTLAYLLPAIVHIVAQAPIRRGNITPIALIMAPTRELAVQIVDEAHKVLKRSKTPERPEGVWAAAVYGGGKKYQQLKDMEYGCEIVAATPGRLIDFMVTKSLSLERVTYLVLDEADRMLEEGFAGEVESISSQVRPERQVLFFSATWSHDVQKLAAGLCNQGAQPVRISVGQDEHGSLSDQKSHVRHARDGIVQTVKVVDFPDDYEKQVAEKRKLLDNYLQGILWNGPEHKVLVFVSQKQYADELATKLWDAGFKATAMHGGKSQESRLRTLEQFRSGEFRLMVATDVIGRGIDIPSVSHVIVFDMGSIDDYVHRIGRTARGKDGHGQAMVFFEYWHKEPGIAGELCDLLEASGQVVPEDLRRIAQEVEAGKRPVFKPKEKWNNRRWNDRWNDDAESKAERSNEWASRDLYHGTREHSQDHRSDWAKRTRHEASRD